MPGAERRTVKMSDLLVGEAWRVLRPPALIGETVRLLGMPDAWIVPEFPDFQALFSYGDLDVAFEARDSSVMVTRSVLRLSNLSDDGPQPKPDVRLGASEIVFDVLPPGLAPEKLGDSLGRLGISERDIARQPVRDASDVSEVFTVDKLGIAISYVTIAGITEMAQVEFS